jgi:hypothetical protein
MRRAISIVLVSWALSGCGPFNYRGSDKDIAVRLMHGIPAGTTRQLFLNEARHRGWKVEGSWEGNRPSQHSDWGGIDGAHVVWVYLDGYYSPLRTDVDSFWAFDEHDRLKGVAVRKTYDAL